MVELFPSKEPTSTKQKILETAIDLFSVNGYSAVSVREITKHVGIKESAMYNHFKTKDEILDTIFDLFRNIQKRALPPIDKLEAILAVQSPQDFLAQGFENFRRTVEDPVLVKLWRILNIEQYRDARARQIIRQEVYVGTIAFLEEAFRLMVDKGRIKPLEPRMLAFEYQYPIFSIMTEYLLLKIDDQDTTDLDELVKAHIQTFTQQVTT